MNPTGGLDLMTASQHGSHVVYSLDVQTLLLITALAFLPGLLLIMSAFPRIVIVLAIFRQALGLTSTPPNILLIALALVLTVFVMRPTIDTLNSEAVQPYLAQKISFNDATAKAESTARKFMLSQTRRRPLHLFVTLAHPKHQWASPKSVPFSVLVPAFVTSELQSAFEIGFLVYIPFVLIDLAVAAVLMALGMIMVSPTMISLPIKLLVFTSIGGWSLLLGSLAQSYVH